MNDEQNRKLTKKEQRLLRRQQEEEEYLRSIRNKKIKKIIMILVPTLLIITWIVVAFINYEQENQGAARLKINPLEYDAGTVSLAGDKVRHAFEIMNEGDGILKIKRIWTSCMCTTAILRIGDSESPKFGMHDNPVFWSGEIAPGESGFLEVTFDQGFHGSEGTGAVTRVVYLNTNDPDNKKAEIRLLADVVR